MPNAVKLLAMSWIWIGLVPTFALATVTTPPLGGKLGAAGNPVIQAVSPKKKSLRWKSAVRESLEFLAIEHGVRMFEQKTRAELKGPFFPDWGTSVRNVSGWGDGDNWLTNYVAHPMEGAVAGYFQVQNDPAGRDRQFGRSKQYWHSRLRAFAFAAGYSTQFELGPISEASLGNVGMIKGTAGFVDLIMSPVAGFGLVILEDALNRYVVRKLEVTTNRRWKLAVYRVFFNPSRSFAGVLGGRFPWQREQVPRAALGKKPSPTPYEFNAPQQTIEEWNQLAWPGVSPATEVQRRS